MRVAEIRSEADLQSLREAWDRLVCESASQTIFLTWEWATAWWSAYGRPGELRILTCWDDNGILRGIAPLRQQTSKAYGQTVPVFSFVGDSSIDAPRFNDSDYLDFIIARGFEDQVIRALRGYFAETLRSGTVLLLNEIPETSPNLALLKRVGESDGMIWAESDVSCATTQLPESWDAFLRMLQPRFRTKVRSVLRNLENRPEVTFQFCNDAAQLDRVLPALFDLHTRRWESEGKPGVFGWERKRDFYFRLSRLLLERGWLRMSWLEWNGQILACQYGFAYQGTYSHLQEGYEPASEHLNLGVGLRAWSIREFLKEGLREYDFLGGAGRHKITWGAEVKNSTRILLARESGRNALFCRAPEVARAAKESVRELVPENLLELRRKHLEQPNGSGSGWLRQAAAAFYFHGKLGTVMGPLRRNYQMSVASQGVSFRKRTRSSARILYYHRVNDKLDPFSEAMSPQLFEEHIRYLSRNYKVASMSEIVKHLAEGDSSEVLFGITFDDGYADNYWHAFPILQRYGVPATIFLTTNGLDSGELLWFERLADAVRKTSREFLDMELDIPRRFWMRTVDERVHSNNEIFGLLRKLTNSERTVWLPRILHDLGAQEAPRNEMLSWDQVRIMSEEGIDFGGHTVTHPFLSKLTPADAAWEVGECKRRIEQEVQKPVEFFAYPNGREEDFADANKEVLRAAGYRAAVTTIWGMNDEFTDRMALKRGGPWENSPAMFATKLDWYQLVNQ
jgi:peptidoglycan/xylan/chitin deacetylase (PgdA/CDA1 family)/CelD/BcsL family acetyltransferase involved in cellulose biosynthesis